MALHVLVLMTVGEMVSPPNCIVQLYSPDLLLFLPPAGVFQTSGHRAQGS